jgi:hypothetical protein
MLWLAHIVGLCTHTINSEKQTSRGLKKTIDDTYSGLCRSDQEWIKTRIKTPICLNSKGNEVIVWCLFSVGLSLLLSNCCRCMCYHCRCWLHHICASQVNNDNVHQSSEVVFGDKDIHSLSSVVREKVGDLPLNMCSTFQDNNYSNILKCVVGYCTLIPVRTPK